MNVYRVFAKSAALTAGLSVLGMSLAGCQTTAKALGMTKVVPDEFRVVTKAPLTVPPDYSLRPPTPGEPRPQELQPESADRAALLGIRASQDRDQGEKLLAARAGADKVLFWKKDKAAAAAAQTAKASGAEAAAPIDPQIEANRLKSLIGDKKVIIQREQTSGVKLPGL